MAHGSDLSGSNPPRSTYYDQGKFGRLFPTLPPFAADSPLVRHALGEIGKKGGLLDANDDLASGPIQLIVDPAKSVHNPDNPDLTAGMTFLGQFLDHDLTFDPTSSLARQQDPEAIRNFRTPIFELDSVYGSGPTASPHLYNQHVDGGRTTLLVEEIPGSETMSLGGARFDVPRNSQGVALVGDPRNDENLIVSQLHVAFVKFHNTVVERVRAELGPSAAASEVFSEAQRLVRWHYQWIIVHEFLPKTVGADLVDDIIDNGRQFYRWRNDPFIPVEFSVAAYRFGHSQVRPSYRANFGTSATDPTKQFFGLIFDATQPAGPDPDDLRGGVRAPRRFVDWQTFFDFGDGRARHNKKIDTTLSTPLFNLLGFAASDNDSLASRNLLRNLVFGVPSGQSVAKAMNQTPLPASELADLEPYHLHDRTPLWFYVLREAQVVNDGKHLGPVGGRIVGEVFLGVLQGDPSSYLRQDPTWTPTLAGNGAFTMTDLLRLAGVVAPLP